MHSTPRIARYVNVLAVSFVLLLGLLCFACGESRTTSVGAESSNGGETPSDAELADALALHDRETARLQSGSVTRADVLRVVSNGLGAFLARVALDPAKEDQKFIGFRVTGSTPGDALFDRLDLLPGDIVTQVNGLPIGHPDEALKAFEHARTANELSVVRRRGHATDTLRFTVVD